MTSLLQEETDSAMVITSSACAIPPNMLKALLELAKFYLTTTFSTAYIAGL